MSAAKRILVVPSNLDIALGLDKVREFKIGEIVSAGVLAGAYPKSHKWNEASTLVHAARVTEGWPVPLCKTVKAEGSVTEDATQFNLKPVSCPACLAKLRKLGVAVPGGAA